MGALQIFYVPFLGALFALIGGAGFWIAMLTNDWRLRLAGLVLLFLSFPAIFSLFDWGSGGDWRAIWWRLCGYCF